VTAQTDAVTGGIRLTNAAGDTIGLQAATNTTGVTVRAYAANNILSASQAVTDSVMTQTVGTVTLNSPGAFRWWNRQRPAVLRWRLHRR
jgi:hypothetical protein